MSSDIIQNIFNLLGLLVVPWIVWVTSSIFTQRQELALTRQILDALAKRS